MQLKKKVRVVMLTVLALILGIFTPPQQVYAAEGYTPMELTEEYEAFIDFHYPLAIAEASAIGLDWQNGIAIAIYESGAGKSDLARNHFNLWGQKTSNPNRTYAWFNSWEHGWHLFYENQQRNYTAEFGHEGDLGAQLQVISDVGYCEGVNYFNEILPILLAVEQYRIEKGYLTSEQYRTVQEVIAESEDMPCYDIDHSDPAEIPTEELAINAAIPSEDLPL